MLLDIRESLSAVAYFCLLLAVLLLVMVGIAMFSAVHAAGRVHHRTTTGFSSGLGLGLAHMVGIDVHLSPDCLTARSLGGPCGCFTSEHFFGHSVRTLWRADSWLRFPRVAAAPGTAAIRAGYRHGHAHVASVASVNGDGTVTISDYNGQRRVRSAGLVFVAPR